MASQRDMLGYHQHQALRDPRARVMDGHDGSAFPSHLYMGHGYDNDQAQEFLDSYYMSQHHADDAYLAGKRTPASMPATRRPSAMPVMEGSFHGHQPHPQQSGPLKRKASDDLSTYDVAPTPKRIASSQLQVHNGVAYDSGHNSPYSQYAATPISTASFQHNGLAPTARMGHQYSTSNASQVSLAAPSPHTPGWSPDFATVKTEPSPQAPPTPVGRPASSSPVKSSIPRLVRTSTIQQPSPVGPNFHQTYTSFNPYAMHNLKASLKLNGKLDSMTKNWTEQELSDRRRLVEFKRSQQGCDIHADFAPVAPEDRAPNSITISCILWKEKNEHYVTSVDTIYLLESLVGVRFTVEEKNRIRRNLEGYRPATVSKSKLDSEEFFKVIMGFPHPKPRNIEKDVKVFPWAILGPALSKIIGKYSASYSSTAGITNTVPSNYGAEMCEMSYPPSPPQDYLAQYAQEQASYASGMIPGRMSAPVTTAPIPQLQVQLPTSGPNYGMNDAFNFNLPGMPQASMMMSTEAMSAPIQAPAGPWEYNHYVNSPATAPPNTAPPGVWNRPQFETADFLPVPYQA